jgi:hypothetical protein
VALGCHLVGHERFAAVLILLPAMVLALAEEFDGFACGGGFEEFGSGGVELTVDGQEFDGQLLGAEGGLADVEAVLTNLADVDGAQEAVGDVLFFAGDGLLELAELGLEDVLLAEDLGQVALLLVLDHFAVSEDGFEFEFEGGGHPWLGCR